MIACWWPTVCWAGRNINTFREHVYMLKLSVFNWSPCQSFIVNICLPSEVLWAMTEYTELHEQNLLVQMCNKRGINLFSCIFTFCPTLWAPSVWDTGSAFWILAVPLLLSLGSAPLPLWPWENFLLLLAVSAVTRGLLLSSYAEVRSLCCKT